MVGYYESSFWAKVKKAGPDDCWEWTASRYAPNGYGSFWNGAGVRAHRFAYELAYGPIPTGALVLHSCDNKGCVNPRHLSLGDHKANARQAVERGQWKPFLGERNGNSRLTALQVRAIRELHSRGNVTYKWIARQVGIHPSHVRDIVLRRKWAHVDSA